MFKKLKEAIQKNRIEKTEKEYIKDMIIQEADIFELLKEIEDVTKEGLSASHTKESIAKKHGVEVEVIEKQIKMGKEIEKEHTNDPEEAKKIAMDHLVEFPDYYDRLKKMEKEAELKESRLFRTYEKIILEETLPAMEKREFAIPSKKKFPLYDKKHVLAAIRFFNWVDSEDEAKLAHAIIAKMKQHGLRKSNVGEDNRLKKYTNRSKLPE